MVTSPSSVPFSSSVNLPVRFSFDLSGGDIGVFTHSDFSSAIRPSTPSSCHGIIGGVRYFELRSKNFHCSAERTDSGGLERAGNHHAAIEKSSATIRQQGHARFESRGIHEGREQQVDIAARTDTPFQRVRRFLVLFQLLQLFISEAGVLIVGVLYVSAAEFKDLQNLFVRTCRAP